MIKSIIFDFDGVILDSVDVKGEAFFELFKNKGEKIQKISKDYHYKNLGVPRHIKIDYILSQYLSDDRNNRNLYLNKFESIVISKVKESNFIYGIKNFLKKNHNNYNFFISSATPTLELSEIVKYKEINKYFLEILGSPKSKIEHIKFIINKYKLKTKEVIFIGDTNNDYKSAYKSKINFIGVKNKYEKFKNQKYVIKNFYNFKNTLNNFNLNIDDKE